MKLIHFIIAILKVKREALFFLDETGTYCNMTPTHARSPKGQRAYCPRSGKRAKRLSLIAALSTKGMISPMALEGSLNGAIFIEYLKHVLLPKMKKGQLLVMDNLKAHKVDGVQQIADKHGIQIIYLPPYSPELSPIELAWSQLKQCLKKKSANTLVLLMKTIKNALLKISEVHSKNYFNHCGYLPPLKL